MQRLCPTAAIAKGSCREFVIDDQAIFLIHKDGVFYAYKNACPHLNIPLNWREHEFLDTDGSLIQCATHGALFLIESGLCVYGPCQNQHLSKLDLRIQGGEIFLA